MNHQTIAYLVGRNGVDVWRPLGVYSDERDAVKRCDTVDDFVMRFQIDKNFSQNEMSGAYYPLLSESESGHVEKLTGRKTAPEFVYKIPILRPRKYLEVPVVSYQRV